MIYIGADHAGYKIKEYVKAYLSSLGYVFEDLGAKEYTPGDDYPDYAKLVCETMTDKDKGILLCDTGIGMSIVANRYHHIRAALCTSIFEAMRSREHNNANVLVIGAETNEQDTIKAMVKVFFDTSFSGEERHERRIHKIP